MLTVAYVIADFPVFSETFIGDEIRAMEAAGNTVVPIVMRPRRERGQDDDQDLAARVYRLSEMPHAGALPALLRPQATAFRAASFMRQQRLLPSKSLFWNAAKVASLARKHRCSHIHAHFSGGAAAHAIVAARMSGLSVSFTCHGHDVYSEPEDLPAKLRAVDFAVSTCSDMTADLRAMAPGAHIAQVFCGIDPKKFRPRHRPHNGKLLFIGRLVEQKGVDDLIAAIAAMPQEKRLACDIVGDGPQRPYLERLAKDKNLLGSHVKFLGPLSRAWLMENGPDYLALAAPFKTGPNGERDSGPIVVKEAMAMGLPVISSRYMGVKDNIIQGCGVLIEPGNVAMLTKALVKVRSWTLQERALVIDTALNRVRTAFTLERQAADLTRLMINAQRTSRRIAGEASVSQTV